MPGLVVDGVQMTETDANYQSTIKYLTVPPANQNDPAFNGTDIAAIKALEDPVRREIYDAMNGSTETFSFDNRDSAVIHWDFRIGTIQAMTSMNAGAINYNYWNPSENIPVTPPGPLWTKGTAPRTFLFRSAPGSKSSDAVVQLVTGAARGECLGAINAAYLIGERNAVSADDFDQRHPAGSLNLAGLGIFQAASDTNTVIPGDYRYFKNKDDYLEQCRARRRTNAMWQGENVVYIGGGKYSGLGLDAKTEDELRDDMQRAYELDMRTTFTGNPTTQIRFTRLDRPQVD
ncbi:MAG TPA: hypothetical protein VMV10_07375 [Pirellulales bacterium]|nr:hypothetical protein [Pirellulales bacterium]